MLATKFFAPRWRRQQVSRPRLAARIDGDAKLVLLCAPPGFGKTTLLAEWLSGKEEPVAWLSLDSTHDDPRTFWAYLVRAMQTARPGLGEAVAAFLDAQTLPPIETLISMLLNEVVALKDELLVVLDDYHVIENAAIHDGMAFLIEQAPETLRIIIASRADPPLHLPRLRARGELIEIRATDLRFSTEEAGAFFGSTMGVRLTPEQLSALEARTEGWIAALQLAALSMQGRDDTAAFIASFTGNDRYIVDYLVDEVLQRQGGTVREFLLRTSVLDRFNAPLCDAVTGEDNGKAILDRLERGNIFVVALDERREWYRYHHLFADVLRLHLEAESPELVPVLHQRASAWYEENGHRPEAIRSALAAKDFSRAACMVELEADTIARHHQPGRLVAWLRLIPDELIRSMPVLSVYYGLALQGMGALEESAARVADAERWLETNGNREAMLVTDPGGLALLASRVALCRGYLAMAASDAQGTTAFAMRALALLREDEHHWRGTGAALLGLAHWARGDLNAAQGPHSEGVESFERAGDSVLAVTSAYADAELMRARGRLTEAKERYERSVRLATAHPGPAKPAASNLLIGLSELLCEFNELGAAAARLEDAEALGLAAGPPRTEYRYTMARARLLHAQGDFGGALNVLDVAEPLFLRGAIPNVRPLGAYRARLKLSQGRIDEVSEWARAEGLSPDDRTEYTREYLHLTLARVLIAIARREGGSREGESAIGLLERLRGSAERGGRLGAAVEALMLLGLAHEASGDHDAALKSLGGSLALAKPAGYIRTFVDEGEPMLDLLRGAVTEGTGGEYARRLLAAFGPQTGATVQKAPSVAAGLAETLTARELEILRLVAAGMQNQAIADHLVISLPTVKRHIANVYGKLDVGTRTAAVARANQLKLL